MKKAVVFGVLGGMVGLAAVIAAGLLVRGWWLETSDSAVRLLFGGGR